MGKDSAVELMRGKSCANYFSYTVTKIPNNSNLMKIVLWLTLLGTVHRSREDFS